MYFCFFESSQLQRSRGVKSLPNDPRRFPGILAGEILIAMRWNLKLNIDAIEQRTGNSGPIALNLQWSAVALFLRIG
jgi:hypothetical protein